MFTQPIMLFGFSNGMCGIFASEWRTPNLPTYCAASVCCAVGAMCVRCVCLGVDVLSGTLSSPAAPLLRRVPVYLRFASLPGCARCIHPKMSRPSDKRYPSWVPIWCGQDVRKASCVCIGMRYALHGTKRNGRIQTQYIWMAIFRPLFVWFVFVAGTMVMMMMSGAQALQHFAFIATVY